ncbi:MAG: DoxX family protein [Bacteroidota bacterium]
MKTTKITYWTSTAIVALMMTLSAYSYFTNPMVKEGFQHLGFPDYFRVELAVAKFIGAVLLLIPIHKRIKEWAYAGFTIVFISAFIAHLASGDPAQNSIMPVIVLILLSLSYFTYHKMQTANRLALA